MLENNFQGDLCHIGTIKLICEASRWTSSCVMRFLPKGCSKQTMLLHLCGNAKYITTLCFSIGEGDAKVPTPSCSWGMEGFLERPLMCRVITRLGCVFTLQAQLHPCHSRQRGSKHLLKKSSTGLESSLLPLLLNVSIS